MIEPVFVATPMALVLDPEVTSSLAGLKRKRVIKPEWSFMLGPEAGWPVGFVIDTRANSLRCVGCKKDISIGGKTDRLEKHLINCMPFNVWVSANQQLESCPPFWVAHMSHKDEKKKTQPGIAEFMVHKLTKEEKIRFQTKIAMYFYTSGTSFVRVQNKWLHEAVDELRVDATLPDRKKLGGALLDTAYMTMMAEAKTYLLTPKTYFTLTTDLWTNVKGNPVINFCAVSTVVSLYLESSKTGVAHHTGEWLAGQVQRIFAAYPGGWVGLVTDNASNNKAMWASLSVQYKRRFFYGCYCHGLHLIVKSILSRPKNAARAAAYPFNDLVSLVADCQSIVKFWKSHHIVGEELEIFQKEDNVNALALWVETRWGGNTKTFVSCYENFDILEKVVRGETWLKPVGASLTAPQKIVREKLKSLIFGEGADAGNKGLKLKLARALAIQAPLDRRIKSFQSNSVPVSDCYDCFLKLDREYSAMSLEYLIPPELAYIKDVLKFRWNFLYSDAHGVAYCLDPRYLGDGMPLNDQEKVQDFICSYPIADNDTAAVPQELQEQRHAHYLSFQSHARKHRSAKSRQFTCFSASPPRTVLSYWEQDGSEWPSIQDLAMRVFSLCATSCEAERSFSTLGFIHSKVRNRLAVGKVDKLAFIKGNDDLLGRRDKSFDADSVDNSCDSCDGSDSE